jgi:hypothetical protein
VTKRGAGKLSRQPYHARCFVILSRWTRWTAVAALVVVPVAVATKAGNAAPAAREVRRIRAHFDSVLTELARAEVGRLTSEQRANRASLVAELHRYRDRGQFPHNYDFPGQLVPYFVDRKTEAVCAVADLLAASGRRDIVDRVARANNNVWVDELAGDTAFTRWLETSGLTLREAARIQIVYASTVTPVETARQISYFTVAPLSVLGSVAMTLWNATGNADGHRGGPVWTGMIAGGLGVSSGALLMTRSSASPDIVGTVGVVTAGSGIVSMIASGAAMHRHRAIVAAQQDSTRRPIVTDASVGPVVAPNGAVGLGMSLRF